MTFNLLHGGTFSEFAGDDEAFEARLRLIVKGRHLFHAVWRRH